MILYDIYQGKEQRETNSTYLGWKMCLLHLWRSLPVGTGTWFEFCGIFLGRFADKEMNSRYFCGRVPSVDPTATAPAKSLLLEDAFLKKTLDFKNHKL